MRHNRIKQTIQQGGVALGVALQIPSPILVEMLGDTGFEFVLLDGEHGLAHTNLPALITAADASGITPMVRVPDHQRGAIVQALELGAGGIVVPMVHIPEQAEQLVHEVKYAPLGGRGFSTATRAAGYGTLSRDEHAQSSNEEVLLMVILESKEAIQNAGAIAQVPGVDLIFIGRDDLSESVGALGDRDAESVHSAMRDIIQSAGDVPVGTTAFMRSDVERWTEAGVRYFLTSSTYPIRMAFQNIRTTLMPETVT